MGRPFQHVFPERWDTIKVEFKKAEKFEVAAGVKEQELFIERNDFVEETYFISTITPLRDEDGRVGGFLDSLHEYVFLGASLEQRDVLYLICRLF
jgi:hypothetical protein